VGNVECRREGNRAARSLYESLGYVVADESARFFSLELD